MRLERCCYRRYHVAVSAAQVPDEPGDARARGAPQGAAIDDQTTALSALEEAIRHALTRTSPEQVLQQVAVTLPIEITNGPDSGFHGKVEKVSVSMPADLTAAVRLRAGAGGFSRYVTEAVQNRVKHDLLGDLLTELEAEHGPVPAEIRDETRRMWPGNAETE
jgi:hypothetical protein